MSLFLSYPFSASCEYTIGSNLIKLGCMRDSQQVPRPLPSKIISRAAEGKEAFNDMKKWEEFIKQLVCDCAVETRKKKWFTFGIQNYGKYFILEFDLGYG